MLPASPSAPPGTRTISILHRWTRAVLYSTEVSLDDPCPMRTAIQRAVSSGSDLSGSNLSDSNLSDSNLSGSNLSGSDLRGSNLSGSNLSGSNLSGSNLSGSNLSGSDLRGSDLSDSNLSGSDLSDSNLSGSDLSGSDLRDSDLRDSNLSGSDLSGSDLRDSDLRDSDLRGSDLSGSDLRDSNLSGIRADLHSRLDRVPGEVAGLLATLRAGKIDGSAYAGDCACFVGTVAKLRGCNPYTVPNLRADASSLTERWFLALCPGHTPENHPVAAITEGWILEWQAARGQGELIVGDATEGTEVAS